MLALLVVLFIAELWVIVLVASAIGVLETVGLLIAITIIGIWLVKRQGVAVLGRLQNTIADGRVPHRELVDGFLILAAGVLLIPPGFITDAVGLALLLPPVRIGIRALLMRSFRRRGSFAVRVIDGFGRRVDYRDVESRESRSGDVRFPEPGTVVGPAHADRLSSSVDDTGIGPRARGGDRRRRARRPSRSRGLHGPPHVAAVFSPGAHVFPGGAVDPEDRSVGLEQRCDGLDDATASAILDVPAGGLGYFVAAARECFEEAGLLLARHDGELVADADLYRHHRDALNAGERSMLEVCVAESLTLAVDLLMPFGHWITPVGPPRRFDTRFFVAPAPPWTGPEPRRLGDDRKDRGCGPIDVLAAADRGHVDLIEPTRHTLSALTEHAAVDDVFAAEVGRAIHVTALPTGAFPAAFHGGPP